MNQLFLMHWALIRYSGLKLKLIREGSTQSEKKWWLGKLEILRKKRFPYSFEGWLLLSSSCCHFPLDIFFYLFWLQHSQGGRARPVHWAQPEILNLLSNKVCLTRRYKWKDEEPPVLNKAKISRIMHYREGGKLGEN